MAFGCRTSWFPGRMTTGWRSRSSSAPHEGDHLVGHAVVVEEVAGDQEQIDLVRQGPVDDALEEAPAALLVRGLLAGVP